MFAFPCRSGQLFSYFLPLLPKPSRMFFYFTCPHIFLINFCSLFLWHIPFPISFYSYFTYLFDYIFIVSSLEMSKLTQFILSLFCIYCMFMAHKLPPIYSFLTLSCLVTPHIHINIIITEISMFLSYFLLCAPLRSIYIW